MPASLRVLALSGCLMLGGALSIERALAHDGVEHASPEEAARHAAETRNQTPAKQAPPLPDEPALPFPVKIEADFDLLDQHGVRRSEADFAGKPMLVFFGYASCEAICSVALPRLAAALDLLGADAEKVQPLLITVDPVNDTPEALARAVPKIHPRLLGLTGSEADLAAAREAFQVGAQRTGELPDGTPIFAHGSFIYLLDGNARVLTILPPILGEDRMAEVIRKYL